MFESSNPALNEKNFSQNYVRTLDKVSVMTMEGTITKAAILVALMIGASVYPWHSAKANPGSILTLGFLFGGLGVGLICSLVMMFTQKPAPFLAPIYAVAQGLFLGALSAYFDTKYNGIALQAFILTVAVLSLMLFLYRMKIIRVTETFRTCMVCAIGAVALVYIVSLVLGFFGIQMSFIRDSSPFSIGFSLVVVGIASLSLALDFDLIEKGSESNLPKYMEWYCAFALLVTLVWLYLEILKLLAKLRGRD